MKKQFRSFLSHLKFAPIIAALICFFILLVLPANAQQEDRGIALASGPVKTLPNRVKRFALIIGVDQYADTQITTLGGSANDARTLANALIQYAGFPSDQVTLLASDQPQERQPTRGNILRRLSNLASIIPKDGLLLVSFAGHGIERGGQAFLLPSDAQVSNDVDLLEQTAINVTQIKDKIRKTGVGQVVMILDACRNDPCGRGEADNPLTNTYTKGFNFDTHNREITAFATLYATEVGYRAYEYKEKKQGYFTWALVEGLKGAAANEHKEVTLASLIKYLQESVPKRVLQDLGQGKEQRPFATIEGYKAEELVISVASAHAPETETSAALRSVDTNLKSSNADTVHTANDLSLSATWSGSSPQSGSFTYEFLQDGSFKYITSVRTVTGNWKQVGNFVQLAMKNGYSVMEGNIEGQLIKVEGTNQEGEKFKFVLIQKNK